MSMKSGGEIRKHRDDLKAARGKPCRCAESGHGRECERGALLIEAAIEALSWALGENPDYEEAVAYVAEAASRHTLRVVGRGGRQ